MTLRYAPTQAHVSGPLGTLRVVTSGGTRNVTITGEALLGRVASSPAAIDFGPVCVGATTSKDFEVYAEAAGTFNLTSVMNPAAPFQWLFGGR